MRKKVLAVASAGGHWVQLQRLEPAFEEATLTYVSTDSALRDICKRPLFIVRDASLWDKIGLFRMAIQMLVIIIRTRPDVVVSTGAAPGFFALMFGKMIGARTIWVDSVANAEQMSLAGQKIRRWADHWLTQWPELQRPGGPTYVGSVL